MQYGYKSLLVKEWKTEPLGHFRINLDLAQA
jgi:hypothetical protein